MIVSNSDGLEYFQFSNFPNEHITQAIFTRKGGKSKEPWASLNIGSTVGDNPEHIDNNLNSILSVLGYDKNQLAQVRQVHSSTVVRMDRPNLIEASLIHADGMVTKEPGILLLMRFADCVPIFLFDPFIKAVGIAHAGWKGTVLHVASEAVRMMQSEFGSDPDNILAGIGPSIGPDHYQIGQEVVGDVKRSFPGKWNEILAEDNDGVKLNLWTANEISLKKAGVSKIEVAEICTACNLKEWFSHRGDKGRTGRFAAAIGIRP
jgi:YfiH family protein